MDSSPSISKTQTRGGIPKPSEKKFGKYRVLQIRREISAHRYVLPDFVGLLCRFAFLSRCPGLGSEGKGGHWYLVSRARWLLILPAPNTYLSIAAALCLCTRYFFQSSRAYCCQDSDREVFAVQLNHILIFHPVYTDKSSSVAIEILYCSYVCV